MNAKEYSKSHGGNIGLEKAFIEGQNEMLRRIKKLFEYGPYDLNAIAFTKHQVIQKIDLLERDINKKYQSNY